jgi:D-sedoheptulose 7-phosphate isomerase
MEEILTWIKNIKNTNKMLASLIVLDGKKRKMNPDRAFKSWVNITRNIRKKGRTVFLIGNGASASMASHVAADLAKNAHIHAEVFSDLSLITAIANDMSYEEVFAEPLRRRMKKGDMLVTISSSGQSQNILRAAKEAKKLKGLIVTVSAMSIDNPLKNMGDLNFFVPAKTYGLAETCHAAILHYWIDLILKHNRKV